MQTWITREITTIVIYINYELDFIRILLANHILYVYIYTYHRKTFYDQIFTRPYSINYVFLKNVLS